MSDLVATAGLFYNLVNSFLKSLMSICTFFDPFPRPKPLSDLFVLAEKKGWHFTQQNAEILDFCLAIREEAVLGHIKLYGRLKRNLYTSLDRLELLNDIPANSWVNLWINFYGAVNCNTEGDGYLKGNNKEMIAYKTKHEDKNGGVKYFDLHYKLDRTGAWLKQTRKIYLGRASTRM